MKERFLRLIKSVDRIGIDDLCNFLENKSDFFIAPSSTRFHGSFEGGLLIHSLNVYDCLCDILKTNTFSDKAFSSDSIILSSLLHDLCKTNYYKVSYRNAKNEVTGQWEKVPYYEVEDTHPYGHGECSVMMIEQFIKLTAEERYAIRWHMAGFDDSVKGGSRTLSAALNKYPFVLALQCADMMAAYILEK